MLLIPRTTEKAYTEQTKRTYIFVVPRDASKQAIADAVSKEFKVTVTDVRTLLRKGKPVRFSRGKHAYPGTTHRQIKKFAYVTLKDGDKIKIFEDEEEDKKPAKKADKTEKKTTKKTKEEKK